MKIPDVSKLMEVAQKFVGQDEAERCLQKDYGRWGRRDSPPRRGERRPDDRQDALPDFRSLPSAVLFAECK